MMRAPSVVNKMRECKATIFSASSVYCMPSSKATCINQHPSNRTSAAVVIVHEHVIFSGDKKSCSACMRSERLFKTREYLI